MMSLAGEIGATTTRPTLVSPGAGPRKFAVEKRFPSAGYRGLEPFSEAFPGKPLGAKTLRILICV